jgi:cyclopropane-fatty-acyl-phospholipid synthase
MLGKLHYGAVEVDYWGVEKKIYGAGKPYFKLLIKKPSVLKAIFKNMDIGFGESYADGDLEVVGDLDQVMRIVSENHEAFTSFNLKPLTYRLQSNKKAKQPKQIQHHYDVGNDFYAMWLDKTMTYTCAYYRKPTDTLEQAQTQKIDHVLRKLQLEKGHQFLDIGCGWGHLVVRAAKLYGASGLGVTLSKEQHKYATELAKKEGVEKLAKFELINYQELINRDVVYDRIISVGVLEHVGRGNHDQYFRVVNKLLKDGGVSVLHSITQITEEPMNPWIDKYIFPGGYIPSAREVIWKLPEFGFNLYDYENLRIHYAMTCAEWLKRFDAHKDEVIKMYDEKFYRMWRLYLASSSGSFRYGTNNLSQLVFIKGRNNDLPLTREHIYK